MQVVVHPQHSKNIAYEPVALTIVQSVTLNNCFVVNIILLRRVRKDKRNLLTGF